MLNISEKVNNTQRFDALESMFDDLKDEDMELLRKTLQIYLDPRNKEMTDLGKIKKLEEILDKKS